MTLESVHELVNVETFQNNYLCKEVISPHGKILIYQAIGERHKKLVGVQEDAACITYSDRTTTIGGSDGMSNPPGGEIVSRLCMKELVLLTQDGRSFNDDPAEFLNQINAQIFGHQGSTFLAAEITKDDELFKVNTLGVGDGSILVIEAGLTSAINYDTSFLGIMARRVHHICNHQSQNGHLSDAEHVELERFAQSLKADFIKLLTEQHQDKVQKDKVTYESIVNQVVERMKNYDQIYSLLNQIEPFKKLSSMLTFCIGGSDPVGFDYESPIPPHPMAKSLNVNLLANSIKVKSGSTVVLHTDGIKFDVELHKQLQSLWIQNESPDFDQIGSILQSYAEVTGDDVTFMMMQLN